ncbi:MAG: transcriptional regulator [Candidatus Eremiobacteraeota bacterium]|nr:transcriptional regulator [Candidatus Eremiobacteraeota bacterium]
MSSRAYGQYCGFARALEVVGERWAFLVVRDLLVGPKRFTDLQNGLAGIPSNVLTARLKELEAAGVVARRIVPRPARAVVYELTPYGAELEEIVVGLGRWGAKAMGDPRAQEIVTLDSLIIALRSTFRSEAARGVRVGYELRAGEIILHARIDDGRIEAAAGPLPHPDLVIEAGPAIKLLMARDITPAQALADGLVRIEGDPQLLDSFVEMFRIDPPPASGAAR